MIDLYEKLAIPEPCYLGKRVFKKLFYENAPLNATAKKAFSEDIDYIEWVYTLKPETINISRFRDDEREYDEVAVIQVFLKADKRYKRIAQVIQRAIPYPVLLVLSHQSAVALSVANKRINRADKNKIVAEKLEDTGWIDLKAPASHEIDFLDSLNIKQFSFNDFYEFYRDLTERIIGLHCAVISGNYTAEAGGEYGNRAETLEAIRALEKRLGELRAELKKETRFSEKIELNIAIKKIRQQLDDQQANLYKDVTNGRDEKT